MTIHKKLWATIGQCCRCGNKQNVFLREWIRAARPRCNLCGGALEEVQDHGASDIATLIDRTTAKKSQKVRDRERQGELRKPRHIGTAHRNRQSARRSR